MQRPSYLEAIMGNAFLSRILPRQKGLGPLTRGVLLIALLTALPGAHADVVPDWNLTTAQTLGAAKAGTGLDQSRVHAMVHGAIFDAVNAIERRYTLTPWISRQRRASQDAATQPLPHTVLGSCIRRNMRRSTPRWQHRWRRYRTVRQRPLASRSAGRRERKCSRCVAMTE